MREEVKQRYEARINELIAKLQQVERGQEDVLHECYPGAVNVFEALYGKDSIQLEELIRLVKELRVINPNPGVMDGRIAKVVRGQLTNALAEVRSGLIQRLYSRAAGEAIGDLALLASEAIDKDQKDVAAVLAAAALEDAMKTKATLLDLDIEGKELAEVVNALKSKSFFQGAQHRVVSSFVKLRNNAMHAEWARIAKPEVESLIAFVKSFALEHF